MEISLFDEGMQSYFSAIIAIDFLCCQSEGKAQSTRGGVDCYGHYDFCGNGNDPGDGQTYSFYDLEYDRDLCHYLFSRIGHSKDFVRSIDRLLLQAVCGPGF